ncbi:uncharacterized protein LOC121762117 [Salvia splendens]|uniref:uncharacterized protein LOC121762117 n=1 Tax=Salvia splendens TaxID=180675 RepID=UPI001C26DA81|nr:uncharacterized protein LOC121762117 [Salvia splendens]
MMDLHTVCCMCGDVGFPDKLFRCSKCRNRSQHSYCSNYYSELAEAIEICDWCQHEQRNPSSSSSSRHGNSTPRNTKHASEARSAYSGDKIKHQRTEETAEKAAGKAPSPRPSARRYKLLKDVMC